MILLESASECGAKGKTIQRAFQAEAGNKGFQPQSKPPVHTGGFDWIEKELNFSTILKKELTKSQK